jgi:synaptic vesicle membrane protein VAT-1
MDNDFLEDLGVSPFIPKPGVGSRIRKVLIARFGDPSVLGILESSIGPPLPGEVQVAPLYAGFSGADIEMRMGTYTSQRGLPLTPGCSLVGRVVSATARSAKDGVRFHTGALVASLTIYGAQATVVNLPAKYLVPVPEDLDPAIACAMVLDWTTAYQMVERTVKVLEGQRIFIHGLSGAVGNALLQLCKLRGAYVYGTASARNHEALHRQHAHSFTYADKNWIPSMQNLGGVHVVFDPLGYSSGQESYSILDETEPSVLVVYGNNLGILSREHAGSSRMWPVAKLMAKNARVWAKKRVRLYAISRDDGFFASDLARLFEMARHGEVEVKIKRVWALDEIQEAHREYGKGEGIGSSLIKISDDFGAA